MTLADAVMAHKATKVHRNDWDSFHPSDIGGRHCTLYLALARTRNKEGLAWDGPLQARMDNGSWNHVRIERDLQDAGFRTEKAWLGKSNQCYWPEHDLPG